MKNQLLLLIFTFLLFTSEQCANSNDSLTTIGQDTIQPLIEAPVDTIPTIQIDDNFSLDINNDIFQIKSVSIDEDILKMEIQYSGGCEVHEFSLVAGKNYMKSYPPQLNVFLKHNANGDACRALVNDVLYFNIKNCRYPGSGNMLILRFNNSTATVKYEY